MNGFNARHPGVHADGRFLPFDITLWSAFEAFQNGIAEIVSAFKRELGRSRRDLNDLGHMGVHCEVPGRRINAQGFPKKVRKILDPILASPYEPRSEAVSHHYP